MGLRFYWWLSLGHHSPFRERAMWVWIPNFDFNFFLFSLYLFIFYLVILSHARHQAYFTFICFVHCIIQFDTQVGIVWPSLLFIYIPMYLYISIHTIIHTLLKSIG